MSRKTKADHRASTRGGGFTGLPHVVQDSPAYRHLSLYARAVLFEVVREFNGFNNGRIGISFDTLADRLNTTNRRSIGAAFVELVEHGLLDVAAAADRRHHKAREYRLTFVSSGDVGNHRQATEEYLRWTPPEAQNHGDDVLPKGAVHGDDVSPRPPFHSDDVSLRLARDRQKTVDRQNRHGDDVLLHIISHVPQAKPAEHEGGCCPPAELPGRRAGGLASVGDRVERRCCEQCGEGFELGRPDRAKPRRYCSETCRKRAENARAYERRQSAGRFVAADERLAGGATR